MTEPIKLVPRAQRELTTAQLDQVRLLSEWLARAQSGEFLAVGICAVTTDYGTLNNFSENTHHPALIGAGQLMVARLIRDRT